MSLTKLFNINYLIQNLKKSKNILIIFSILVPLFTMLTVVLIANDNNQITILEQEIEIVNVLGMYVIPTIISICLFGYVFKKNSVDFINSMPINRKSIFVTNTIGGIILITGIQLITLILTYIASLFFDEMIIFNQLYIDVFFMMLVSYIFVFVSANLAMTISGNWLTQIAVTMLILFLVPFCIDTLDGFSSSKEMLLANNRYEFIAYKEHGKNFTKPYQIFSNWVKYGDYETYSEAVMLKMLGLSIGYFAIGIILFEKRKMENTEESFANVYLHLFVKILTLIPMLVFLNLMNGSVIFTIFGIALIAVYYFVYDLLTKRKVNFILSALSFIIAVAVIYGASEVIKNNNINNELYLDEILEISVGGRVNEFYDESTKIYISDKDIINFMYKNIESNVRNSYISYNGKKDNTPIPCYFRLKNGEEYRVIYMLDEEKIDTLKNMLKNNNEYQNKRKAILNKVEKDNLVFGKKLDEDTANIVIREIQEHKNDSYVDGEKTMQAYTYDNHEVQTIKIPITLTDDLFKAVTKFSNTNAIKIIKERQSQNHTSYYYIDNMYFDENNYKKDFDYSRKEIEKFILNHPNEVCDKNKKYYRISSYGNNGDVQFYTNKTDEIDAIIKIETEENNNFYIDTQVVE